MGTITDITEQKRRKERVNVFIDGEFWCGMHHLCQTDLGLEIGLEVGPERLQELEAHVVENEALLYCVAALSARARTEAQLRSKLLEKGYAEGVITTVIARCYELVLLDDELYARSLAEAAHANGRGRKRVAERLRTDGVEAEVAESALSQIFDEADDEHERAQETLYTRFPAPLSRVEQRRALAFLQRRGYGSAVAQSVVKDHAATDENDLGPNTEEALRLLRRKYPTLNPRNLQESKRAQAFLARRGCSFAIIREALRRLQD